MGTCMKNHITVRFHKRDGDIMNEVAISFKISVAELLRQCFYVYMKLRELTGRTDMQPRELFEYFLQQQKKLQVKEYDLDRVAWYIVKLCYTVQALKDNPSQGQQLRANGIIKQVEERLKVDLTELKEAIKKYTEAKTKENLLALNEALKKAIMKLITDALKAEVVTQ